MTIYKCLLSDACPKSRPVGYICCRYCEILECKKRCMNSPDRCERSLEFKGVRYEDLRQR